MHQATLDSPMVSYRYPAVILWINCNNRQKNPQKVKIAQMRSVIRSAGYGTENDLGDYPRPVHTGRGYMAVFPQ